MPRKAFGIPLLSALLLPSLCYGDITITFLDSSEPVQFSINSSGPLSCGTEPNPEACTLETSGTYTPNVNLMFNIFEPGGVVLSDTLQITTPSTGIDINSFFQSDTDGGLPLVPFINGTAITEDGTAQTAATVHAVGFDYVVRFQSDIDPVPEPRYMGLLSLGLLGIAVVAWRKRERGLLE
jgi:hypothetical protein